MFMIMLPNSARVDVAHREKYSKLGGIYWIFLWKRILICVNIISILLWIFIIIIFIYIAIIIVQNNLIHKIHWYIHDITLLTKN